MEAAERWSVDMGFSERLTALRKQKGFTQQILADAAGVHVVQIRRYEGGKTQPTLEIIRKLAIALAASADELLFEKDERNPAEDLRYQFEAVSAFDKEDRAVAKAVLDSLILRHDAKRLIGSEKAS